MNYFFTLLFFFQIAQANAFKVEILELSGNYKSPVGKAVAKKFVIEDFTHFAPLDSPPLVEIFIEKKESSLDFNYGDQYFFWEDPPQILLNANDINLEKVKIQTYKQVVKAKATSLRFDSLKDFFKLDLFSLFCQNPGRSSPPPADFVINACSTQAKITTKSVVYRDKTGINFLSKFLKRFSPDGNKVQDLIIRQFNLSVVKHSFTLDANIDSTIRGKIKARGSSWYNVKKKELKIRLDLVKLSFFNITRKVFEELEKNQSENMQVRRPFIYLHSKSE